MTALQLRKWLRSLFRPSAIVEPGDNRRRRGHVPRRGHDVHGGRERRTSCRAEIGLARRLTALSGGDDDGDLAVRLARRHDADLYVVPEGGEKLHQALGRKGCAPQKFHLKERARFRQRQEGTSSLGSCAAKKKPHPAGVMAQLQAELSLRSDLVRESRWAQRFFGLENRISSKSAANLDRNRRRIRRGRLSCVVRPDARAIAPTA